VTPWLSSGSVVIATFLHVGTSISQRIVMNRVSRLIYSMTRSAAVKDSKQPVACENQHLSVADGVSSSLANESVFQTTDVIRNFADNEGEVNEAKRAVFDISSVSSSQVDKMSALQKENDATTTEHHLPLAEILNKEIKHSGVQSRFRIVKIESKGLFKRGRWTCRDFADPPEAKASDLAETQSAGNSSTTEPVFYVQGAGPAVSQLIFYSEGHPVLESDALPCTSKLLIDEIAGSISTTETGSTTLLDMCRPSADSSNDRVSADSGLRSIDVANSDAGSDGTVGTGLGDRHHDFDRLPWPAAPEESNTPLLLSLVVDDSSEFAVAR